MAIFTDSKADVLSNNMDLQDGTLTTTGNVTCNDITTSQEVTIGNTLTVNNGWIQPPRYSTTQINNLVGMPSGSITYNTDTNKFMGYNGSAWANIAWE